VNAREKQPPRHGLPAVYFACAISAGRQDAETYSRLVGALSAEARVLTAEFAAVDFVEDPLLSAAAVNERDLDWLVSADALIAEITVPSLGVGYEIAKAESWSKPVLCLHRAEAGQPSPMITGARGVRTVQYRRTNELSPVLRSFLRSRV
jgi:hypothetical protein